MNGRALNRRPALAAALVLGMAAAIAGCGSAAVPTPAGTTMCERWCGTGSATVATPRSNTTISGGSCVDLGAAGIDARFGDWWENGTGDFLVLTAYRSDGPTPTPAPTQDPSASPLESQYPTPTVSGSIAGQPFTLGTDTVISMKDGGGGSYSGTDSNGAGKVSGTFSCH